MIIALLASMALNGWLAYWLVIWIRREDYQSQEADRWWKLAVWGHE